MKQLKLTILALALVILALVAFAPRLGVTNFDSVHLRDTGPTSQPVLRVDQLGAGKIVEFLDGGTPVFSINNGGGIVASTILTQGAVITNLVVSAPTAVGTAIPAAIINNDGVSNILELRDASTPVFTVNNGGAWSSVGAGTHTGAQTFNGGSTDNAWVKVAAPTAIATATPAAVIDSAGVSNLLEVRKNATPVFVVGNGGVVTGQVLQNTLGQEVTCGVQSITAAATVVHGVSTPVAVLCTIAADPTGSQICTYTNAAGVVTVKVWQEIASTPTANGAAVNVSWCVVGTP